MKKLLLISLITSSLGLFAKNPDLKVVSITNTIMADSLKFEATITSDTSGPILTAVVFISNDATLDASDQIRLASQGVLQKGTLNFSGVIKFTNEKIDSNNKYTILVITHDYVGSPLQLDLSGLKPDANPNDNFMVKSFAFPPSVVKAHNAPLSTNDGIDPVKITFATYESTANATAMNITKITNCNTHFLQYSKNFKITNTNTKDVSNVTAKVFLSKDGTIDDNDYLAHTSVISLPKSSDFILNAQSVKEFLNATDDEIKNFMSNFVNWTSTAEYGQPAKSFVLLQLSIPVNNIINIKTITFGEVSGYKYTTGVCQGTEEKENSQNIITKSGLNTYQITSNDPVEINIFDINGTLILKTNNSEIDLNSFAKGLYIINMNSSTISQSERIIVE
jgi:hypothetical protein